MAENRNPLRRQERWIAMTEAGPGDLWLGVDHLIDRTSDLEALRAHGLHLLAARRWRQRGHDVPPELSYHEQIAAITTLAVPPLLRELRAILDEPVVVIKGPEIARHYPDPALRPFVDLDLLVADADVAHRKLLAAGFTLVRDEAKDRGSHHRPPLRAPGWPLHIEIHHSAGWLPWMSSPNDRDVLASAIPSALDVEGVLTLPRSTHALLVAVHSWRHVPLRRVLDLVDVAVMMEGVDTAETEELARRWGMHRLWTTTRTAVDALLIDPSRVSWPLRLWARHLADVRELTDGQAILLRWLGTLWAPTPVRAIRAALTGARDDLAPLPEEAWPSALRRTARSAGQAVAAWSPLRQRR